MNHRIMFRQFSASLILAVAPGAVYAEMYRCVAHDGSVTFTDNAAACPGAVKHEISDRVQNIPPDSDPIPAAPESLLRQDTQNRDSEQQAQREQWQQKKRAAEEQLRAVEERQTRLARVVTGCNRGSEIITRDSTGLKYKVSCDDIRREHVEAGEQATHLRTYLASGLRRECREAGCLPGWIR